jgi:hypothetical protein
MTRYLQIACLALMAILPNGLIFYAGTMPFACWPVTALAVFGGMVCQYLFVILLLERYGAIEPDRD